LENVCKQAKAAVEDARQLIAERSKELHIPSWAQPSIQVYWNRRNGQTACKERRAELIRVAKAKAEALERLHSA
jgi:hypothetical protein